MSLKVFHVLFIVSAMSLCLFFGAWALQQSYRHEAADYAVMGAFALLAAAALFVYLVLFRRKTKGL